MLFLGLLGLFFFVSILIYRLKTSKFYFFDIVLLLCAFSILDFFIPTIIWSFRGVREYHGQNVEYYDVVKGQMFYILFYLLMLLPFLIPLNRIKPVDFKVVYKLNTLFYLSLFFMIMAIVSWLSEVYSHGGFSEWLLNMSISRFKGELDENYNLNFLVIIPFRIIFNGLVFITFSIRKISPKKYKFLFTYIFPLIAVFLALTTFFRGAIIMLFLGFVFAEIIRIKIEQLFKKNKGELKLISLIKGNYKIVLVLFIGVIAFFAYGIYRGKLQDQALDLSGEKGENHVSFLQEGYGALSMSHIMKNYSGGLDYMYGKTYLDMLLLPVPRVIYTSKPEWYGIDDITRKMNWPEISQSAVTIPGEAYANFGVLGLVIAPLVGLIFLYLHASLLRPNLGYYWLFPATYLYIISTANWMSFTGIVNQLPMFLSFRIILYLIVKRR